ncbi:unnamed protein product [Aspergillus oryzae]|nr:unnamed protein product [Aspergillus oryzae]GMF93623.1 unnamed protein product [Aspergillus oryzae]
MKLIYRGRNGDLYALPASHLENEDGGSAAQSDAIGRSGRGFPTSRSPWQMIFEMPCGVGMGVDIHWKSAKAQASSADEHILDTKPGHPRINSERYTCRDYVADECNDDEPFSDKLGNNQRPRRCKISEMERKEPYLTIGISVVRENNRRYGSDSKADKGGSNTRDNPWLFLESHFVSDGC